MGLDKFAGRNHDEPMTERRWAGLLRAVNVGGRKMPMAELRQLAEEAGFTEVSTLLASGNLLFTGAGSEGDIRGRLERSIADHTGFTVEVLLRSKEQLRAMLANNPFPDGRPAQVLVCFLDAVAPAALADKLAGVAVNERIAIVDTEIWIDCVDGIGTSKLASRLPALVKPRIVTGRNVNTVAKLADLL